jgi:diaminohydroxyphosphoribosylaminopyrimidine deaminase / 5-amino-6-(5-phosphoribosylamino)uracil reductase
MSLENLETDEKYMRLALRLARKGEGRTSPNPMVGAVIVRGTQVVGRGYHHRAGDPHAEVLALRMAGEKSRGGTLYVNLEPCNHFGRTPPCTEAVLKGRIRRVVVGMKDPNRLVAGKGIRRLRRAGVRVEVGVLKDSCRELNAPYGKFITKHRPFVILKAAMSLDGKIATRTGNGRWVSGEASRDYGHFLRQTVDAILVGIGTVRKDNPLLTARPERGKAFKQPLRIVVDSRLRIPLDAQILQTAGRYPTLIATTSSASPAKIRQVEGKAAKVWVLPQDSQGRVNLGKLMQKLGAQGVVSVLLEGGAGLNASVIKKQLVDRFLFFLAPKIVGGVGAPGAVGGEGVRLMRQAIPAEFMRVGRIGPDLVIEAKPKGKE